jgi:hypothetical protein
VSAATACDDFAEEMAMAEARATKLAQSPIPQRAEEQPSAQIATPIPSPSQSMSPAATEPMPAPTQTTENSAGTLRR